MKIQPPIGIVSCALLCFLGNTTYAGEPLYPYPKNRTPEGGFVAEAETARKIAEVIVSNRFGKEEMEKYRPYEVRFVPKWKAWEIYGTGVPLIDGKPAVMGGEPHVVIRKSDGAILSCWMTK